MSEATPPGGRQLVQLLSSQGASTLAGLVATVHLARILGPERFGKVALVVGVGALVYGLFESQVSAAVTRHAGEFFAQGDAGSVRATVRLGYSIDLALAGACAALVAITSPLVGSVVVHDEQGWLLLIVYAVLLLPRSQGGSAIAVLGVLGRLERVAQVQSASSVARIALVLALPALLGVNEMTAVLALGGGYALEGLALRWCADGLLSRQLAVSSITKLSRERRNEIVRFLLLTNANTTLLLTAKQLDLIVLGIFRDPASVGIYRVAKSVAGLSTNLVTPMQHVLMPRLVASGEGTGGERIRRHLREFAIPVGMIFALGVAASVFLVPRAIDVAVGSAYDASVTPAIILVLGAAVWTAFFWARPVLLVTGAMKQYLVTSAVAAVVAVVGYVLGASLQGIVGVALAASLSTYALANVLAAIIAWRSCPVGPATSLLGDELPARS